MTDKKRIVESAVDAIIADRVASKPLDSGNNKPFMMLQAEACFK